MNKNKWSLRVSIGILTVLMPIVVLLSSTLCFALNPPFFLAFFNTHGTAADVGVDSQGLHTVTRSITDYLAGAKDSMDVHVPVNGADTKFFNKRELDHMTDVRKLFDGVRMLAGFGAVICLGLFFFLKKNGGWSAVCRGFLGAGAGALALLAFLGFLALTDFEKAFIAFHKIFFSNSLWLLDPATSRLIRMLPEDFFNRMVLWILGLFGLVHVALAVFGFRGLKRVRR